MNQRFNIGCSAYDNGYWTGVFYPNDIERNQRFEFYCQYFSTFEINSTFYKFPTARTLRTWYHKSPADFTFSVKAPQEITHRKRFLDCTTEIKSFYEICQSGMGEKLARILFQFPASFVFSEQLFGNILDNIDNSFQNVIEFRHASWWRGDVIKTLEAQNITFCSVSYPKLPDQIIATHRPYIRLHGDEKLFYSGYSNAYLQKMLATIKRIDADEIYIYFNNTASIAGILNALEMNVLTGQ